jgi:UDP-N-acetylmuramate--alanine ligase
MGDAFGRAFDRADVVVVTDVYAAAEEPIPGVSGRIVSDAVRKNRPDGVALYVPRLEEAAGFVAGLAQPGDVVLTLGAGDVTTAAPRILQLLTERDQPRP